MNYDDAQDFIQENSLDFFDEQTLLDMDETDIELLEKLLVYHDEEVLYIYWEDYESDFSTFEEKYKGVYEDYGEFARENCEDFVEIPSFLESHVDYEGLGEELAQDFSDFEMSDGKIVFFYN